LPSADGAAPFADLHVVQPSTHITAPCLHKGLHNAYRTIHQQTNSRSVKSQTSQLVD